MFTAKTNRRQRFRLEHHELAGGSVAVHRVVKVQALTVVSSVPSVQQQEHLSDHTVKFISL